MSTNPLTPKPENLPAELLDMMAADAGQGVSFAGADQLLSMLTIAQSNSPIVDKRDPAYVDNAEAGDFVLRSGGISTPRSGTSGIIVIPAGMTHSWVVWRPQRQGFVARYLQEPAGLVEKIEHDESGRSKPVLQLDDNVVQQSRDIFLLIADDQGGWAPFLMPCVSTLHTFARGWNSYWRQVQHPRTGGVMPCYGHQYRLTTYQRKNALGRWFTPRYEDLGLVTDMAAFNLARDLYRIIDEQQNASGEAGTTRPAA